MTTSQRVSEVLCRHTIHNVLFLGLQAMKAPVVEVGEAGMIPVQGVGMKAGQEVGGASNMLTSTTRVGHMIPEGDTSPLMSVRTQIPT